MDVRYPIGAMQVPETITLDDIKGWTEEIASFPTRIIETVGSVSDEAMNSTYREGSWTVRQLVHHIADAQLNLYQRIKLALTVENPAISPFDEEKWAVLPDTNFPVESSIHLIDGINSRLVNLIQNLNEDQFKRAFIHAVDGNITVAETVAKCAWHANHHLAHIKLALENN